MRIAYLLADNSLWGGVKVVYEQVCALRARGHDAFVVSPDAPPDWYDVEAGVELVHVATLEPAAVPDADVIVGTFYTTIPAAHYSGAGLAVHLCQGYEGDLPHLHSERSAIEAVYALPLPCLTVTEALATRMRACFGKHAVAVGQGIDRERFHPGDSEDRSPQVPRVLLAGPFEAASKGVREGLAALAAVRAAMPIHVVRVSSLPQSDEERALGVVDEFHHRLRPAAMPDLYRSCDLLLAPCTPAEGFGLPALEALACGVPTIVTDIPAFRSYDARFDWTTPVPAGDTGAMATAVKALLCDPELRRRLRARGLEIASSRRLAAVAERIEATLTAWLEDGAGHHPDPGEDLLAAARSSTS